MINIFRRGNPGTYDDPAFIQLFWSRVAPPNRMGCWLWTLKPDKYGYGKMRVNLTEEKTHRITWILAYGPIPPGIFVCHSCDNPPCCRPDHLFLGTHLDNIEDMNQKGRRYRLSKLTESQVLKIRELHASGEFKNNDLAEMFGVSRKTIYRIQKRIHWKFLTGESSVKKTDKIKSDFPPLQKSLF